MSLVCSIPGCTSTRGGSSHFGSPKNVEALFDVFGIPQHERTRSFRVCREHGELLWGLYDTYVDKGDEGDTGHWVYQQVPQHFSELLRGKVIINVEIE